MRTRRFHLLGVGILSAGLVLGLKLQAVSDIYSTDYDGLYPNDLSKLTPHYLKIMPNCPTAATDTYSATYQCASSPDAYTFCCAGNHHKAGEGYPAYDSYDGLKERP